MLVAINCSLGFIASMLGGCYLHLNMISVHLSRIADSLEAEEDEEE